MKTTASMLTAFTHILGSTAAAQLLLLASTPLLMHLYSQVEFGVFGTAAAIAVVVSVAVSLRLDHSLHLADDPNGLLGSCLQIIALGALVIGVPVLALSVVRADPTIATTLAFAVAHAAWTTTTLYLNRQNCFRAIALQNLIPPTIFIGGALGAEHIAIGNPLMFWQAAGYVAGAASGLFMIRSDLSFAPFSALGGTLHRYRDDLRYLVPARVLSLLSSNVAVLGSAWLYGPEIAGLVVVANRVSRAPVRVLGNGMSNVIRASIMLPGALAPTYFRVCAVAAATGALAITGVAAMPDDAYPRLFGADWKGLGPVLLVTTTAAAFQLLAASVDSLLNTYDKRASFHVSLALGGGGLLAVAVATALEWPVMAYLWASCALVALVYAASFVLSYGIVRRQRAQATEAEP